MNNLFRKGSKQDMIPHEQLHSQCKDLAKDMSKAGTPYPQPYFQGVTAKRRFVTLQVMGSIITEMASHLGQADVSKEDPIMTGQPLQWLRSESILQHAKADKKEWHVQDWMLSGSQCSAYSNARSKLLEAAGSDAAVLADQP